jgi:hypothetical protein
MLEVNKKEKIQKYAKLLWLFHSSKKFKMLIIKVYNFNFFIPTSTFSMFLNFKKSFYKTSLEMRKYIFEIS